jgi:hypothetical protein
MSHAKALRLIGQTLEAAKIEAFRVEKRENDYRLWVGSKQMLSFTLADVLRLDAQAQKKRRTIATNSRRPPATLSQRMRALGGYLDHLDVSVFGIVWKKTTIILNYQCRGGERYYRAFTEQELRQLGQDRSRQRSSRYIFLQLDS